MKFGFKIKLTILLVIIGAMAASVFCYAEDFGLGEAGSVSGLTENKITAAGSIPVILGDLVGVALSMLGIFFFILVLYAGFIWMTAAGSGEQVDKAKKILMSGAIGLVIVLSAYTITSYVFTEFLAGAPSGKTGTDICKTAVDGQDCGDNSLCKTKKCVTECAYTYGTNAKCSTSACAGVEVPGLCPGGTDNVCCVAQYDYDAIHEIDLGTAPPTTETSGLTSCSSVGGFCDASCDAFASEGFVANTELYCSQSSQVCCVNSCMVKGGACVTESACTAVSGKQEAESCGAGQVCCITCASQGGVCFTGTGSCSGKVLSGTKNGCTAGESCCLGGSL